MNKFLHAPWRFIISPVCGFMVWNVPLPGWLIPYVLGGYIGSMPKKARAHFAAQRAEAKGDGEGE